MDKYNFDLTVQDFVLLHFIAIRLCRMWTSSICYTELLNCFANCDEKVIRLCLKRNEEKRI